METHQFGGDWTERKLEVLRQYLTQYLLIFSRNVRARHFRTVYVDAFAGTGERASPQGSTSDVYDLIGDPSDPDRTGYQDGSATIALELERRFDEYLFIEKHGPRAEKLRSVIEERFPELKPRCKILNGDANALLRRWTLETDWSRTRAVVFLDPYGMAVEWETIRAIASTRGIDLWVLFPVGTGVNRLLTRSGVPAPEWQSRLNTIFGTVEWWDRFYKKSPQVTLFGSEGEHVKDASFESIGNFFLERLRTVFAEVAPHAMPLKNSRNNPLYWLCFAAGNPRGAKTAVRIADHLLRPRG